MVYERIPYNFINEGTDVQGRGAIFAPLAEAIIERIFTLVEISK